MTAPRPPSFPPGTPAEVVANAAALYRFERSAVRAVVGPVRSAVRSLVREFTRRWVRRFGSTTRRADPPQMRTYLTELSSTLHVMRPQAGAELARRAASARDLGVRHAITEIPIAVDPDPLTGLMLPVDVRRAIHDLDGEMTAKLARAARAAQQVDGDEYGDVVREVFAPAQQAVTTAERTTTWVTNSAAADGARAVAEEVGAERLWIAERDACPYCLILSGHLSVDGVWDHTETFGVRPLAVWPDPPLRGTPRHPHCRCRTQVWLEGSTGGRSVDFPAALRREAERSILLGWRLPSDSIRFRLATAEWLLDRGTNLPASVQARARTAVRRGQFANRRTRSTR